MGGGASHTTQQLQQPYKHDVQHGNTRRPAIDSSLLLVPANVECAAPTDARTHLIEHGISLDEAAQWLRLRRVWRRWCRARHQHHRNRLCAELVARKVRLAIRQPGDGHRAALRASLAAPQPYTERKRLYFALWRRCTCDAGLVRRLRQYHLLRRWRERAALRRWCRAHVRRRRLVASWAHWRRRECGGLACDAAPSSLPSCAPAKVEASAVRVDAPVDSNEGDDACVALSEVCGEEGTEVEVTLNGGGTVQPAPPRRHGTSACVGDDTYVRSDVLVAVQEAACAHTGYREDSGVQADDSTQDEEKHAMSRVRMHHVHVDNTASGVTCECETAEENTRDEGCISEDEKPRASMGKASPSSVATTTCGLSAAPSQSDSDVAALKEHIACLHAEREMFLQRIVELQTRVDEMTRECAARERAQAQAAAEAQAARHSRELDVRRLEHLITLLRQERREMLANMLHP